MPIYQYPSPIFPLAWAADAARADAVRFILENGADVNADAFGNTTELPAAAQGGSDAGERDPAGYQETARLLIKYGVEINRRTNYDNATALDDALRKGNHHVGAVLRQASDTQREHAHGQPEASSKLHSQFGRHFRLPVM